MSVLGENLKKRRLELNISQEEISKIINKSNVTYSRYETGTLKPDIDTLILLAETYKTSIDALTGRDLTLMLKAGYRMGYQKGEETGDKIKAKRVRKKRTT